MAFGALGSDTGGSIRIPAALSGVVGLKPTYGRISLRGAAPLSWTLDHAGPLTRSVEDAALLLKILAGYDPGDPASVSRPVDDYAAALAGDIRGLRVGVPREFFFEGLDPGVERAAREALDELGRLGVALVPVSAGPAEEAQPASGTILLAEAAAFHEERLNSSPERFGAPVYQRMRAGLDIRGADYARARRVGARFSQHLTTLFSEVDLIATPTVAIPAPTLAEAREIAPRELNRLTNPFNLSGSPALSLPCGFTAAGLPVGLQLVGRHWDEATILKVGHAYQLRTDWHRRTP
jgi:Asp-tRNA(Asn)/Glu-tRNA(Gln) amidotransferase A subunit family amidase